MLASASALWGALPTFGLREKPIGKTFIPLWGTNTLQSLMPSWMLYVGFVLLFVGGILGALLGHKMLKKHFERAGIV